LIGLGFVPRNHWPSGFDAVANRERRELMKWMEADLPRSSRRLVRLRYRNDLTFPQIAIAMDRTVESVEAMHARALTKMRDKLAEANIHKLTELL
jgi:DNA-directed RNA polymerase specialized sigma24 family protein